MWSSPGRGRILAQGLRYAYPDPERPSERFLSLLAARGPTPSPGQPWVLEDVDLEVGPGETLGILGRNGAGKSTLLQLLAGLAEPGGGRIAVSGRAFALLEPGAGLDPDLTGRENLLLRAAMLGVPRAAAEAMVPAMAEFSGVGAALDRPLRTFSAGMQLRLGFALLAALEPDVVLIDEALAVGDVFFQQRCLDLLRGPLAAAAKVLVSHDVPALLSLSSRVMILEAGRVAWVGAPAGALDAYRRLGSPSARPSREADPSGWVVPGPSPRDGALALVLVAVRVARPDGGKAEVVRPGDPVVIELEVWAKRPSPAPAVGYYLADRLGLPLFGTSSLSSGRPLPPLPAGAHRIRMGFTWPRVEAGEYLLTVGLSEGLDPSGAEPQGWATGVHAFRALQEAGSGCRFELPFSELAILPSCRREGTG